MNIKALPHQFSMNYSGLKMSYFKTSLSTDISKGIVEFRDLPKKEDGYLLNDKDKSTVNSDYTDNPSFCPNRYSNASSNISDMLTRSTATYDWYAFLCPMSSGVKLESLKKFVTQAGLDTSILTSSEWSKYST